MQAKAGLRGQARAARAGAHARGQGQAAELLADYLGALLARQGGALAGYMPIQTEIDPRPALAVAPVPVCLPVIQGRDLPLRFREWSPGSPLVEGAFRALIPAEGAWLEPRVLIVPLLAFDARGFRLGYGGGFYDRTLERLRARAALSEGAAPVRAVGFAFAAQEVEAVPVEPTDQPLDAIVTEAGVIEPPGA
ncbi:5-formyltetrahydrofolate cyclo-ligase [Pseudogemmobacter sonorensis]|uniref:5-formyltetrahydrofolate cyclo-ligase n=1 Tax=Pseudogemmobacter sonorensis TaxID=2989681 RepID=UPI003F67E50E